MFESVLPFFEVNDLSEIFGSSMEQISFETFSKIKFSLEGLPSLSENSFNPSDEYDNALRREVLEFSGECEYYDCENFKSISPNYFSVLFCNICSFSKNFENFYADHIYENPSKPNIFAFCETRITNDTQHLFHIPGYEIIYNNRNSRGGGLLLALCQSIKFTTISECTFMFEFIESLFVKITIGNHTFFLGVIYRPPRSNPTLFLEYYAKILEHVGNQTCYISGDFNFDLIKYEINNQVRSYVDLSTEFLFRPIINRPTRITNRSTTIIDHIWTNNLHDTVESGILMHDCSDHFAPFILIPNLTKCESSAETILFRDWRMLDSDEFSHHVLSEFRNLKCDQISSVSEIETSLELLSSKLQTSVDRFCPTKTLTINPDKKFSPWFSADVKNLIKVKNKLYRKYVRKPISYGREYRNVRNQLNNLIKYKKKLYYKNLLLKYNNNARKYWSVLNDLLCRKKNASCKKLEINGVIIENKSDIANEFKNYFSAVTNDIVNELPDANISFESYMNPNFTSSFLLNQILPDKIIDIIAGMNETNSSPGIPMKVIKRCSSLISVPLCNILNKCIQFGYFPESFKTAKIVPVFKSKNNLLSSNYRPISLLPVLSKIFEKHIYTELMKYVEDNNILCPQQAGFRRNSSTNIAIAKLVRNIVSSFECRETGICIFLDQRKAFDMVDHDILLRKLELYGVTGTTHNLFSTYLSDRFQYVYLDGIESDIAPIVRGIPQGSVLSALLFLLFINDIVNSSNRLAFNLFADDTSLYFQHQNIQLLHSIVNEELEKVGLWLAANRLAINVDKTSYLLFNPPRVMPPLPEILMYGSPILRQENIKFLGVFIDEKLTWKKHAHFVISKISRMLGIMHKIKFNLPLSALKTIYLSLIQSSLHYGLIFWHGVSSDLRNKIFRLQKKAIRLVTGSSTFSHTEPLFKKSKVLKLDDLYELEACKFVHHELLFGNNFDILRHSDIHRYPTRSSNNLVPPHFRTNIGKNFILSKGLNLYNSLPIAYKQLDNIGSFKCIVKLDLINSYSSN